MLEYFSIFELGLANRSMFNKLVAAIFVNAGIFGFAISTYWGALDYAALGPSKPDAKKFVHFLERNANEH